MMLKWVVRKIEEYNSFEIPFPEHEQYHAGRTKQHGGPRVAHVRSRVNMSQNAQSGWGSILWSMVV